MKAGFSPLAGLRLFFMGICVLIVSIERIKGGSQMKIGKYSLALLLVMAGCTAQPAVSPSSDCGNRKFDTDGRTAGQRVGYAVGGNQCSICLNG